MTLICFWFSLKKKKNRTHHCRSRHEQRAAVTVLPKLLPVVLAAVQLPILLVVPVRQVVAAHRAPEGAKTVVIVFAWH